MKTAPQPPIPPGSPGAPGVTPRAADRRSRPSGSARRRRRDRRADAPCGRWGPAPDRTEAGGGAGGAGPLRSVRGEWGGRGREQGRGRQRRLAGSERREERGGSPPGCGSARPGPPASVGGREWARWALPSSCSLRPGRADARIASRARGLQAAPAQPCDAARSGAPRAAGGSLKDARHRPHIPPDWCKVAGGRIPLLFPPAGAGARVWRLGRAGPPAGAWRSAAAEPTCPTRSPARAPRRVPPPPPGREMGAAPPGEARAPRRALRTPSGARARSPASGPASSASTCVRGPRLARSPRVTPRVSEERRRAQDRRPLSWVLATGWSPSAPPPSPGGPRPPAARAGRKTGRIF